MALAPALRALFAHTAEVWRYDPTEAPALEDDRGNPDDPVVMTMQPTGLVIDCRFELFQAGRFRDLDIVGIDDREVTVGDYTCILPGDADVKERDRLRWVERDLTFEVFAVLIEDDEDGAHHIEAVCRKIF